MNKNILKWSVIAVAPTALLAFTSCSSTSSNPPPPVTTSSASVQQGVPGGVVVETVKVTAKVTAIDADKRKVTLIDSDGKKLTVKCGPDVVNFDQIRVDDQLNVSVTEQLAVFMATGAAPPSDAAAAAVVLAPVGSKPGGIVAQTMQVTATVTAIDLKRHKATLQFEDGTTRTVAVRPDVDLTQRKVGETVVIRCTEALAISVDKS